MENSDISSNFMISYKAPLHTFKGIL